MWWVGLKVSRRARPQRWETTAAADAAAAASNSERRVKQIKRSAPVIIDQYLNVPRVFAALASWPASSVFSSSFRVELISRAKIQLKRLGKRSSLSTLLRLIKAGNCYWKIRGKERERERKSGIWKRKVYIYKRGCVPSTHRERQSGGDRKDVQRVRGLLAQRSVEHVAAA